MWAIIMTKGEILTSQTWFLHSHTQIVCENSVLRWKIAYPSLYLQGYDKRYL